MSQFFKLVAELGLPIAATVGMGVFILFIIKYILNGIVNSIKFIESVIQQLDNRIKTMKAGEMQYILPYSTVLAF